MSTLVTDEVNGVTSSLLVKWGVHDIKGLDQKRAEAIGLEVATKRIGYGSTSQELPALLQHTGSIARYCMRTAELMVQSSERWVEIERTTRDANEYYKGLLTESRVQEEAYRTAADILGKILARPSLLNVWELSCPGLLRSKTRELGLQKVGTPVYLETLKERTRIELIYDTVVALKKIEEHRPIKPSDIAEHHAAVAAKAAGHQKKIMEQEAALARELRELGDGSEFIEKYRECLERSLPTNELYLRGQVLLSVPVELFQLTHLELLDLTENGITELPGQVGQLVHLSKLYLDSNKLTRLPHELHKLSTTLTLLGISNNPLEPQLMQLYYAGLPVLLAHLKATRPRRSPFGATASPVTSPGRALSGDVVNFNLFDTALPNYPMPSPAKAVATS